MERYAKSLHNPFQGVVQVLDTQASRALSYDGTQWELQYRCDMQKLKPAQAQYQPRFQYARVGRWDARDGFKPYPLDPVIDRADVEHTCLPLLVEFAHLRPPLPQDDHYEWWLLDERERRPLALLASFRHAEDIASVTSHPHWKALNAAQLAIESTAEETRRNLPPANYRLEQAVRNRAGQNPQVCWFQRQPDGSGVAVNGGAGKSMMAASEFPELLLREDWENPQAQDLCQRYLQRLAPQLLVLERLSREGRKRLEHLASPYAQEVDRYFHLYPDVADQQHITALRVEARLRAAVL